MTFAPILICTLNRHEHFIRCVESLSKCYNAVFTELFISVDYPLHEYQVAGNDLIKQYLPSITGFKSVNIVMRTRNYGVHDNWTDMMDFVFKNNDRIIITEDDNIFSNLFIDYINIGLNKFQNSGDIFSISGYHFPVTVPDSLNNDIYLWQGFAAWGVGVWKEKWDKMKDSCNSLDDSIKYTRSFFSSLKNLYGLFKVANHFVPTLLYCIKNKCFLGDAHYSLYMYRNNLFSVFPPISLVRNLGQDGSGVNSGVDKKNTYINQPLLSDRFNWNFIPTHKVLINKLVYNHFKTTLIGRIKLIFNLILYFLSKNNFL
jgi:hypothetical protein